MNTPISRTRRHIHADHGHREHVDRGGNHDGEDLAELLPGREQLAAGELAEHADDIDGAGDQHDQRDVERKEAGLRPFGPPADPGLEAADDADRGEQRHEQRHSDFDRPVEAVPPVLCEDSLIVL